MRRLFLIPIHSLFFVLCFIPTVVFAYNSTFSLRFESKDLTYEKVGNYDRVKLAGCSFSADPGKPLLPVKYVQIAIPADVEVERVEITSSDYQEIPGTYWVYPAQPFLPASDLPTGGKGDEFVQPDPSVYTLSSKYPGTLAGVTNNGFLSDQHIAGVVLYPLQYIPSEKKLILYTQIEFRLVFIPTTHFPAPVYKRSERVANFYSSIAKSVVINPEDVDIEPIGILPLAEEVDYLIITADSLDSAFQPLADWKIRKGISTRIITTDSVYLNHPEGYDNPEMIRNCIRDYYANHGTLWVLLGGDTAIVPCRYVKGPVPIADTIIPSDMYFSGLDGSWDDNGNHIYGDTSGGISDIVDYYPEVFVGRAPSNTVDQAQTFAYKCLTYEVNPPLDYQKRILYAAYKFGPACDGGECKDSIDRRYVPDYFHVTKLYTRFGNLNLENLRYSLNQGQGIVNHIGHGNYDQLQIGINEFGEFICWNNQNTDALQNIRHFSLIYSFGCRTAGIDKDCIGEHFLNNRNGGGVGYCGNSRMGFFDPNDPLNGPGPDFDSTFFYSLFKNKNYQIGKTLACSKTYLVPKNISADYRATQFALLLLGDPTLDIWTNTPESLYVTHDLYCYVGTNSFGVNVKNVYNDNVDNALVCCVMDGKILGRDSTNGGSAMVHFDDTLANTGYMHITVTKHNYLPYQDSVMVLPAHGPYVIYHSHQINDSQGNQHGRINPGDTIWMPITVMNVGRDTAHSVRATLRKGKEDRFITITDSVKSFDDIASLDSATSQGSYVFQVDSSCPDSHVVSFTLEVTSNESTWSSTFSDTVLVPDFSLTGIPNTVFVRQGDFTDIETYLISIGGFNQPVALNASQLHIDVNGIFNPDLLTPPGSSVFRISASSTAAAGYYPITVTAAGGDITHSLQVVLGIMALPYQGRVWHIATTGNDTLYNGSETYPFKTIQKGINSAGPGDTVLVEKGIYVEHIDFLGKAIMVGSNFINDHLESTINSTIIDGNDTGNVVSFWNHEDSSSIIRGFTITRGYAHDERGGGISCYYSSPTIVDNILVENACRDQIQGSAIFCGFRSSAKIYRNLIYNSHGPAAINLFSTSNAKLINNTICNNEKGGLSFTHDSNVYIKNNIFFNNSDYGIQRYIAHTSSIAGTVRIAYNDVYTRDHQDHNYDGLPDSTGFNGNISADPIFEDISTYNYHLSLILPDSISPCIDAGDPADSVPPGAGARIDMGAFEYWYQGPCLFHFSHHIDDSGGNYNGWVNPGEDITMTVTLKNNGSMAATGVSGILSTDDHFIAIANNYGSFGYIDEGDTATSQGGYTFHVASSCPSPDTVKFIMEITDNGSSSWISSFAEIVSVPDFALTTIPDTLLVQPSDSGELTLIVTSFGGFNSEVILRDTLLHSGVRGRFDPNPLTPTDTSIFTISVDSVVPYGIYTGTIIATGGDTTHYKEFKYKVLTIGDCNGDGKIDIGDIVYLLNYLFYTGPAPVSLGSGDANCDGQVNVGDVVYLINYLFKGDRAPGCD